MSRLVLVRHGQASFMAEDYDQLSDIGLLQSERLGEYWASDAVLRFDAVVYGPAKRHAQTGDAVAREFQRKGREFPAPVRLDEFDEYQAFELLRAALPGLMERDAEIAAMEIEFRSEKDPVKAARAFERLFQRVTALWANGEIHADGVEPWDAFRNRVRQGLSEVQRLAGKHTTVAVFTSGGPIAAAMGVALDLCATKTMELSWASRNASYSEFLFSGSRFSLNGFNAHPHLTAPELLTYR